MAYLRGQSNAKGGGGLAETLQFHRIIDSQTERMRELISDLLDVAHIETGTGQASQHHAGVLRQRTSEAGAREELRRVTVVGRRSPCNHLLQGDGELVRAERPALPDLLPESYYSVPGVPSARLLPPHSKRWRM